MAKSKINYRKPGNELLDFMINEGKLLWFVNALVPELEEGELFDYSAEQESMQKFILDAPFISYFGKDALPRPGAFIGYRIVDRYMQQNREISLHGLMQEYDPQKVLKGSRYKPA